RVAVEGGAEDLGEAREAHRLRVQDAAGVAEMVHFTAVSGSAGRGSTACGGRAGPACPAWRCRCPRPRWAASRAARARRSRRGRALRRAGAGPPVRPAVDGACFLVESCSQLVAPCGTEA